LNLEYIYRHEREFELEKNRRREVKCKLQNLPVLLFSPGTAFILFASEFGWQVLKSSSVMVEVAMCCCPPISLDRRPERKLSSRGERSGSDAATSLMPGASYRRLDYNDNTRCKTAQPCFTWNKDEEETEQAQYVRERWRQGPGEEKGINDDQGERLQNSLRPGVETVVSGPKLHTLSSFY
jgi:hypothetical protein